MKMQCTCGHVIVDQTDYLRYKGHMISDQDLFDLLDAIDEAVEKSGPEPKDKEKALMRVRFLFSDMAQIFYQCMSCGRLFSENDEFTQESPYNGGSVLSSAFKDQWKRPLAGYWNDEEEESFKGFLTGASMGGKPAPTFNSYPELEEAYWAAFHQLKEQNILRSAHLKKNNGLIHSWSM
jgi:hypothetical protein